MLSLTSQAKESNLPAVCAIVPLSYVGLLLDGLWAAHQSTAHGLGRKGLLGCHVLDDHRYTWPVMVQCCYRMSLQRDMHRAKRPLKMRRMTFENAPAQPRDEGHSEGVAQPECWVPLVMYRRSCSSAWTCAIRPGG